MITDEQIEALMYEAGVAGDHLMVYRCKNALSGSVAARADCAEALSNAAAMDDDPIIDVPVDLGGPGRTWADLGAYLDDQPANAAGHCRRRRVRSVSTEPSRSLPARRWGDRPEPARHVAKHPP